MWLASLVAAFLTRVEGPHRLRLPLHSCGNSLFGMAVAPVRSREHLGLYQNFNPCRHARSLLRPLHRNWVEGVHNPCEGRWSELDLDAPPHGQTDCNVVNVREVSVNKEPVVKLLSNKG